MQFVQCPPRPTFRLQGTLKFVWLFLAISVQTALGSSVLNFPRLSGSSDELTGIALVNPNNQLATIFFTAYGSDGVPLAGPGIVNPRVESAFARRQFSALTSDLFPGLDPSTVAWVQATSVANGIDGFFLILDPAVTQLDGAELPEAATRVVFRVVRFGGGYKTELNLVNPNAVEAQVTLRIAGLGPETSRMVALPAMGAARLDAAEFFGLASPPDNSTAVVATCPVPIAGFELVRGTGDSLGLNARAVGENAEPLFFPQLAVLDPFQTELQTLNLGEEQARLTISAFRPDGTLFDVQNASQNPVVRILQPGQSLTENVEAMFGFSALETLEGSLRIDSESPEIEATLSYAIPSIGSLAAVAGVRQGRTREIFSHIATTRGFFTGVAILNPTSVTANLQIAAISLEGETLGSTSLTLGPGERVSRLITDFIPAAADHAGGLVWIVSDIPVRSTSLFGSQSGVLANIPPQSIPESYLPDDVPAPTTTTPRLSALTPGQSQTFEWSGRGIMPLWKVNGIPGGDDQVGTIDSLGVYHAPATPPGTLPVSVTAERGTEKAGATVDLLGLPETVVDLGLLESVAYSEVEGRLYVAEINSQIGGGGEAGAEILDLTGGGQRLLASFQGEEISKMIIHRLNDRDYLFLAARTAGVVIRLDPDTLESRFIVENLNSPNSLALDPVTGDLLVAETHRIGRVPASRLRIGLPSPASEGPSPASPGSITTVFQGGDLKGVAVDRCSGHIYASDAQEGTVIEYNRASRTTRAVAEELDEPGQLLPLYRRGIACPASFHLLAIERGADRIRLVAPADGLSLEWLDVRGLEDLASMHNDGSAEIESLLLAAFPRGISGSVLEVELPRVYRTTPEVNP